MKNICDVQLYNTTRINIVNKDLMMFDALYFSIYKYGNRSQQTERKDMSERSDLLKSPNQSGRLTLYVAKVSSKAPSSMAAFSLRTLAALLP